MARKSRKLLARVRARIMRGETPGAFGSPSRTTGPDARPCACGRLKGRNGHDHLRMRAQCREEIELRKRRAQALVELVRV
jgi:hypothetical protein